jgi:acyl carrier protein
VVVNNDSSSDEARLAFYSRVRTLVSELWQAEFRDSAIPNFADDDNLYDLGVIDSLSGVELITWLEEEAGRQVDVLAIDPATFFTLRGLWQFMSPGP